MSRKSAAPYLAGAKEDLLCPSCQELFVSPQTPKQLLCSHVYCQVCLEKMVEGGQGVVNCPECHATTAVPPKTSTSDGGIAGLKTVNQLLNLAENHLKHIDTLKESLPSDLELRQKNVPFCSEHEEEKMYFYCLTCDELVCQACLVLDHDKTKHQITGAKVVYKDQLVEIKKLIKTASDDLNCEDLLKVVEEHKKHTEDTLTAKEQEIDQAIAEIVTKVNKQGEDMKEHIRKYTHGRLQVCQKLEQDIEAFKDLQSEVENKVEKASPYEYLEKHKSLVVKIKKTNIDVGQLDESHCREFKMVTSSVEQILCIVRKRQIKEVQNIYHLDLGTDTTCIKVCGEQNIFVLYTHKHVSVYNKEQVFGTYKHYTRLRTKSPPVVEVINKRKILIATENSVCVYKPSGRCERTFCSTEGMQRLTNISRFLDGRVVLGDVERKTLTMYGSNGGQRVKSFEVGLEPVCLTALKAPHIAVCNPSIFWKPAQLCVYNMDTGEQTLSVDVRGIRCMCYDKESDCLIVARSDKKIVQYWVSPWTFIKEIGEIEGVPFSMAFADKDDLVVSTVGSGRVHVYKCIG